MILVYVILSRRIPRMKSNRNIYKGRFLYFRSDSIHLVPLSASQYTITYSAYTPFFYIRAITYRFCSILYAISTADAFDVCCCCCSHRISEELSNSKIDSTQSETSPIRIYWIRQEKWLDPCWIPFVTARLPNVASENRYVSYKSKWRPTFVTPTHSHTCTSKVENC